MSDLKTSKMFQSALTLAALGIVFGDIGTSPLYAVREAFHGPHAMPVTANNIFGVLSLIVWSLILVISIKYLIFVLRADNKGEGGVLALTALAAPPRYVSKFFWNRVLLYLGLFGSSLLFGDGVITPAISVLSAVEGLKVATPFFEPFVIPLTIAILGGLFLVQRHGTAKIGSVFGPVILIWFTVIGSLGIYGITGHPEILLALSPTYAIQFFIHNGIHGFTVLGAVFLVVTGGEALYADMGHLGKNPIQRAWFMFALPGLLLNYFGQGALILANPEAAENPFYKLAPGWMLYLLVIIATMATVIASQALISGVFSLTRQAVQLGYFPRVRIVHTSGLEIGQIYIPTINWNLFALTSWLVFSFGSSSALASAYGIAVSITMVITTLLACSVAYQRWRWSIWAITGVLTLFMSVDLVFLSANFTKVADGGWFPLTMAIVVFTMMITWREGRKILAKELAIKTLPLEEFLLSLKNKTLVEVSGIAIFMSGSLDGTPIALLQNVKHNRCLHEQSIILTVISDEVPHIPKSNRLEIIKIQDRFFRIVARYGFMDSPDMGEILVCAAQQGFPIDSSKVTYYLGRETLIASKKAKMDWFRDRLFVVMSRNAEGAMEYFNIPSDRVIELGVQVEI